MSETIESQQEELRRAQAEELHRRDQQLLHEQFKKQNWDLREAHKKSLKEMEELKKFISQRGQTQEKLPGSSEWHNAKQIKRTHSGVADAQVNKKGELGG